MDEWWEMKISGITLIPEECDPEEVKETSNFGWFCILVAGKLFKEHNNALSGTAFQSLMECEYRASFAEVGLIDRLDWDFALRLTYLCYEAKCTPKPRKTLPIVKGRGLKCWCGSDAENLDHLWPLSKGGPVHPTLSKEGGMKDHKWNFMPTCNFHNGLKSATPQLIYRPGFLDDLKKYVFRVVDW